MDALLRAVRKSPTAGTGKSKHKKLGEGWGENKEPVKDGMTFYMKYIGSTLVEELPDDESYGDGISAHAVQSIISMAKSAGKKLKKVSLTISQRGIRMADLITREVLFDLSIYRISFCTADKTHDRVFAFIARNAVNETMECHAYFCTKRKLAQAVTLTVSQAFLLAQEKWENSEKAANGDHGSKSDQIVPPLPQPETGSTTSASKNQIPPALSYPSHRNTSSNIKRTWQEFDEDEDLEDDFSRLAQNRGRRLPSFSTDLSKDDVDEGVQQYMDGKQNLEEFSRQPSMEDLLNL